jgi:hypothetical protein
MIQQWLLRATGDDGDGTDLLPIGNAYLLSSTYGVKSGGVERLLALNIHSGEIEAIAASAFPNTANFYVLKVKDEEPTWEVYYTKYSDRLNQCLAYYTDDIDSWLQVNNCTSLPIADKFKWSYESNSGFIRSKGQKCINMSGASNYNPLKLANCDNVDSRRWTRFSPSGRSADAYSFKSRQANNRTIYVTSGPFGSGASKGDILIWEYNTGSSSDDYDTKSDWFVK